MYKLIVLAVCAAVMVSDVNAQLGGGSMWELMMLSQLMNNNNNQNTGSGSSSTPGSSKPSTSTGTLNGGASQRSNPLSSLLSGGNNNMFRNAMLMTGNTEAFAEIYRCGFLGIPAIFCAQRSLV